MGFLTVGPGNIPPTGSDCKKNLHVCKRGYIPDMLATAELISASSQFLQLQDSLERARAVPLYRAPLAKVAADSPALESLQQLPLLTKSDLRSRFPENFLGENATEKMLPACPRSTCRSLPVRAS